MLLQISWLVGLSAGRIGLIGHLAYRLVWAGVTLCQMLVHVHKTGAFWSFLDFRFHTISISILSIMIGLRLTLAAD